jgi:hypothetical protein
LWFVCIGKYCWQKHQQNCNATLPSLLALVTLGEAAHLDLEMNVISKASEAGVFVDRKCQFCQ